ncbi:unnamed protein product [Gordionus sp. m RMFG-2023]
MPRQPFNRGSGSNHERREERAFKNRRRHRGKIVSCYNCGGPHVVRNCGHVLHQRYENIGSRISRPWEEQNEVRRGADWRTMLGPIIDTSPTGKSEDRLPIMRSIMETTTVGERELRRIEAKYTMPVAAVPPIVPPTVCNQIQNGNFPIDDIFNLSLRPGLNEIWDLLGFLDQ